VAPAGAPASAARSIAEADLREVLPQIGVPTRFDAELRAFLRAPVPAR
jgi:hypothetical protein